jgi:hypothetical protein
MTGDSTTRNQNKIRWRPDVTLDDFREHSGETFEPLFPRRQTVVCRNPLCLAEFEDSMPDEVLRHCGECHKPGCTECTAECGCTGCAGVYHSSCLLVVGRDERGREERWRRSCCLTSAAEIQAEAEDLLREAARMRETAGVQS